MAKRPGQIGPFFVFESAQSNRYGSSKTSKNERTGIGNRATLHCFHA
jgi:hypothetical protein